MSVSTTVPPTVQIRRVHLIGLVTVVAVLAATITWLLVAFSFDSGTPTGPEGTPRTSTPAATMALEPGHWPGPPPYPPGFRGAP